MPPQFPCKNCPDRYVGCHSKCEKYLTVKRDWDKQREEARLKMESLAYSQNRIAKGRDAFAKARKDTRGHKWFRKT